MELPVIWAALIAFAVLAYVVLDGFDLGVGILFVAEHQDEDRDVMVNSVAPVWDGNETWLVLGGGGLFAVFPLAYATIMPALYPSIIGMLLALVFRGVAFEFRYRAATRSGRRLWDLSFVLGSTVAAFCQGLTLGGLLQGIHVVNRAYAGGWWDWLTGFSVLTGFALVAGYALLGACWLVWKTEGALQGRARVLARGAGLLLLLAIALVSAIMPFLQPEFRARWFGFPTLLLAAPVPLLVAVLGWKLFDSLAEPSDTRRWWHDAVPFWCALGLFLLSYAGLGISLWPNIVPPDIDIWEAAAPRSSQLFLLVGAAVLIPVILGYTAYVYWLFRGKVRHGEGYH